MKFITLVIIMQAVLASSLDTSNNVTDNHDTEMTRSLRGMGMGGKGTGGMGHGMVEGAVQVEIAEKPCRSFSVYFKTETRLNGR